MSRPQSISVCAVETGRPGEPLENVLHNMLVMKAADRKQWSGEEVKQTSHPAIKRLKLKQRTTDKT